MPQIASSHGPLLYYTRIKVVNSFDELVSAPFCDGVNAICWERTLQGDFDEVVERLAVGKGITTIEESCLLSLHLSEAGCIARDIIHADLEMLRARELLPVLDCVNGYLHEDDAEEKAKPVPTHVQSFHADSSTVEVDTYLCTYHGSSSEGLLNEEARRFVEIPETRMELLALYGGEDAEGFLEYLKENFFDLHFVALPHARPYQFGVGNLWRIAIEYLGKR